MCAAAARAIASAGGPDGSGATPATGGGTAEANALLLKWQAILLGQLAGGKSSPLPPAERVATALQVLNSLRAAAASLPRDASVQTALGRWYLRSCLMSAEEAAAAREALGGLSSPDSPLVGRREERLEQALAHSADAWSRRPSKKSGVQAGQASRLLGRGAEAQGWLRRALALPGAGRADAQADETAEEWLDGL